MQLFYFQQYVMGFLQIFLKPLCVFPVVILMGGEYGRIVYYLPIYNWRIPSFAKNLPIV